jgi:hypothetical protein
MPADFSKYDELVNSFNEDYGLDFSFKKFEVKLYQNQNLPALFGTSMNRDAALTVEGQTYINQFSSLYKTAVSNVFEKKVESFNIEEMMNRYVELMDGFKAAYKEQGQELPKWPKNSVLLEGTEKSMQDFPKDSISYIADKYLKGEVRLRDMRAFTEQLQVESTPVLNDVVQVLQCAKAIQQVNDQRSFWWRVFHPIQNRAEQRNAKMMQDYVDNTLRDEDYATMDDIANGKIFSKMDEDLKMLKVVETSKEQSKEIAERQKDRIQVKEGAIEEPAKTTEKIQTIDTPTKANDKQL